MTETVLYVRLPNDQVKADLMAYAKENNRSLNGQVVEVLMQELVRYQAFKSRPDKQWKPYNTPSKANLPTPVKVDK